MSFVPGSSRSPNPRTVQGTKPGVLDSTQPDRLLHIPGSTLSFAVFDPLTASGGATNQARKRSDADPVRPKRIVIETPPGGRGQGRWRFVPRAHRAPGVEDEGVWPRRVILCGEPYVFSEDQWDIYKLDPAYDCYVPQWPADPVITRKEHQPDYNAHLADDVRKRRPSTPLSDDGSHSPRIHKKFRRVVNLVTDEEGTDIETATESDDEDEVEEIVADEFARGGPRRTNGYTHSKEHRRYARRKEQREKLKANMTSSSFESRRSKTPEIVDLTMEDDSPPTETGTNGVPPAGTTKRKVFSSEETPSADHAHRPSKKPRTEPDLLDAVRRKRAERERHRTAQLRERERMKEDWERRLWEDVISANSRAPSNGFQNDAGVNGHHERTSPEVAMDSKPVDEEESRHQAEIEESRRKLAELEKDRPLWEEEARKRAARERAEEEARRARKEEERRRSEAASREEERKRQRAAAAAADAERRARAEKERMAREREERRRRERVRWSWAPWTEVRAIERYKTLSEEFDAAKFSPENPVMFETIPWPVLQSPVTLRVEDIEWSAVEDFFAAARRHMRPQDYKAFVEKSHKRFHPDRWRARGVLKSVEDEELRGCLEVAANTVAQALTPIWKEVRG